MSHLTSPHQLWYQLMGWKLGWIKICTVTNMLSNHKFSNLAKSQCNLRIFTRSGAEWKSPQQGGQVGQKVGINSSLCTVPFMPFLKCPSAMPFLKCPSAMPFLNCPSRIRFLKMPFLNYFPPKDALPQNSFPKKCPSLTCPPTIPHQRQCKHCNN